MVTSPAAGMGGLILESCLAADAPWHGVSASCGLRLWVPLGFASAAISRARKHRTGVANGTQPEIQGLTKH